MLGIFRRGFKGLLGSEQEVYRVDIGDKELYASGFEILVRVESRRDKDGVYGVSISAMRNMIHIMRERMSRSSQVYIVTRITKHLGGTAVICLDKKPDVGLLCKLASSSIEALSNRAIRIRELSRSEILNCLVTHRGSGGEFIEINTFFSEELSPYSDEIPLPRMPKVEEGILVGETARSRIRQKIYLPLDILLRHTAIFGSTGSGKSTTAASIAVRARAKGARVYILDWHGEYRDMLEGFAGYRHIAISLSHVASIMRSLIDKPSYVLEIFEAVLDLTPAQSHLLSLALRSLRSVDSTNIFDRLVNAIENHREDARWVSETKFSLLRKIQPFVEGGVRSGEDGELNLLSSGGLVIIDLSEMERESLKSLSSLTVLKTLEILSRENRDFTQEKKIVVVDEAQHIFKRTEGGSVIRNMLAETRKWNLGLVIVSQSPSSLGEDSLKNTNTKVVHSIRSDLDRRIIRDSMIVTEEIEKILPGLDIGEAVIASPIFPVAVLAKIYPPSHGEIGSS
jgi:KaiC/GvpD/RAD55 family RecA-like ATPase